MSFPFLSADDALIGQAGVGVLTTAAVIPTLVVPDKKSMNTVGSSFTLSPAQIRAGIMYVVTDADKIITLPTGADMTADFVTVFGQVPPTGMCLTMLLVNGTANKVTIATNTEFGENSATANEIADHSSRLLYFYKTVASANQWDCIF